MPFRFVHTADIHLDAPLRSLALRDAALAAAVATATRTALARIVDLCLAERVDALLIAGDLYDRGQTSISTARFVRDQFARLDAAAIPAFLIRGNHDAASRIAGEMALPPSVTVYGARAGVVSRTAGALTVAIHGVSFNRPEAPDSLLPRFGPPVAGAVNIGLMHTSLNGAPGHDPYAPCSLADLRATAFRYWALGHIHVRAEHPGPVHVVMPGTPQGRDIGEAGPRSVTLVTVGDDGGLTTEERRVAPVQFDRVRVDLAGAADRDDALRRIRAAARAAAAAAAADASVLRLTLAGAGADLHWLLRRDRDLIAAEVQGDGVWIEGVALAAAPADAPAGPGALDDLARIVAAEVLDRPGFAARAAARAEALIASLPAEARGIFGATEDDRAATLADLARDGAADVLAALRPADRDGAG